MIYGYLIVLSFRWPTSQAVFQLGQYPLYRRSVIEIVTIRHHSWCDASCHLAIAEITIVELSVIIDNNRDYIAFIEPVRAVKNGMQVNRAASDKAIFIVREGFEGNISNVAFFISYARNSIRKRIQLKIRECHVASRNHSYGLSYLISIFESNCGSYIRFSFPRPFGQIICKKVYYFSAKPGGAGQTHISQQRNGRPLFGLARIRQERSCLLEKNRHVVNFGRLQLSFKPFSLFDGFLHLLVGRIGLSCRYQTTPSDRTESRYRAPKSYNRACDGRAISELVREIPIENPPQQETRGYRGDHTEGHRERIPFFLAVDWIIRNMWRLRQFFAVHGSPYSSAHNAHLAKTTVVTSRSTSFFGGDS